VRAVYAAGNMNSLNRSKALALTLL